jgi:hypothetical protein
VVHGQRRKREIRVQYLLPELAPGEGRTGVPRKDNVTAEYFLEESSSCTIILSKSTALTDGHFVSFNVPSNPIDI